MWGGKTTKKKSPVPYAELFNYKNLLPFILILLKGCLLFPFSGGRKQELGDRCLVILRGPLDHKPQLTLV